MEMIYIVGLPHCGSTIYGMKLAHEYKGKALMLGEIDYVFNEDFGNDKYADENTNMICSCKKNMKECSFWGDYFKQKFNSQDEKSRWIIKKAKEKGYSIIINTHKFPLPLKAWKKHIKIKEVFYLYRNPMGWAMSSYNAELRSGKKPKNVIIHFILWGILNFLREQSLRRIIKNYKVVYINKKIILPEQKIEHHIAVSNRMKYNI